MNLIDCDELPVLSALTYGGATGSKIGVRLNDEIFMLKSQQRLWDRNFKNVTLSYANDPVTEYIGSHVYNLARVPVHITLLGTYNGKLCVLCKDLAYPGQIIEFRMLRNALMDENIIQHSSGMSTALSSILEVIDKTKAMPREALLERFWTMFAIDSIIGNTDRNNGNWGFLRKELELYMCPVYDCGGCLNNKRSEEQMATDIVTGNVNNLAINYTFNFLDDKDKRINPFHYMKDHMNSYLQNGINIAASISMLDVRALLETLRGIITDTQLEFYYKIMYLRMKEMQKYATSVDSVYINNTEELLRLCISNNIRNPKALRLLAAHSHENISNIPQLFKAVCALYKDH